MFLAWVPRNCVFFANNSLIDIKVVVSNTSRGMERNEKKTEDEDIGVKKKEEKQATEVNKKEENDEAKEEKVEMDRLMALEYHQKAQVIDLTFIILGIAPA